MGLLDKLLKEIVDPNADFTTQIRTICDQILAEEKEKIQYPDLLPKGPRVFLSLEAPGRYDKEIGFLTLEREDEEKYIIVYHTLEKYRIEQGIPPRRRKVWEVDENKVEKIVREYAKKLKIIKGE
jgi:hypothetical protein